MSLITCHQEQYADIRFQDGGLPHAAGVCSYQVIRASADPQWAPEGRGFTYNHAAMLAYWQGRFWYEYLAGQRGEHEAPSAVYLCQSPDGIHWERPRELFPSCDISVLPYCGPGKELLDKERTPLIAHHRMGFYTSSSDRLLATSFYGICPDIHIPPNNGYGVGRVVREIYRDGSLSAIYFLRYNTPAGYNRENTDLFLPFEESGDEGFEEACRELLAEPAVTQQWWEEERLDRDFFPCSGGKALSYYTLPDGRIMGVFKDSLVSISCDGGKSWSIPQKEPSIITSTGKVWGQRMPDGNYALIYNPSPDGAHRWPLAITTGENGQDFYGLAAVVPEIAPCRYEGALKNLGAQYVRGITEANKSPDDQAVWIAYSETKEDMWAARIPVPVRTRWTGPVKDCLDCMDEKELRNTWNLTVPAWGGAELELHNGHRRLHLWEQDPYNRTLAERLFEEAEQVRIRMILEAETVSHDKLAVFVQSRDGQKLLTVVFTPKGLAAVRIGGRDQKLGDYIKGVPMELMITIDCRSCSYEAELLQEGRQMRRRGATGAAVRRAERIVTATRYELPFQGLEDNGRNGDIGNLPDADKPVSCNSLFIDGLFISGIGE